MHQFGVVSEKNESRRIGFGLCGVIYFKLSSLTAWAIMSRYRLLDYIIHGSGR